MKKVRLHLYLDESVANAFNKHLERVGYDKSKLFQKILESFLEKNTKNS